MKNKEKFAKEIVEIACDRGSVAVSKAIGEPVYCNEINCRDCLLNNNGCSNALRRWAESEYIERPQDMDKEMVDAAMEDMDVDGDYIIDRIQREVDKNERLTKAIQKAKERAADS